MKKKLLAILLALGLVITCMPMMAAFAATEIEENPLKFEKTGENAYTVTLTMPSTYLEGGVATVQLGFDFPEKFTMTERSFSPNNLSLTDEDGESVSATIQRPKVDEANKSKSLIAAYICAEGNYIKNEEFGLTAKFTTETAPTKDDGYFKITSYYVDKKAGNETTATPIVRTVGYSGADTAAYTLDADRFAVAANSAEGTAEHTHTYTVGDYVWQNLDNPEKVSCTATKTCTDENCSGEGKTVTETVTMGNGIEKKEEKAATCTEKGNMTYTANFVDAAFGTQTKSVDILASGHTLLHHDKMEATEIADGNIEYWECSKCNKNFSDAEGTIEVTDITIPKTGAKYTVTYTIERCGVPENKEITGYLCKKDSDYSTDITDDQFRKEKTGLQENEIKKVTTAGSEITFNEVTAGSYVLVILGDETTRSTRVDVVVENQNISGQAKLYLFGDVNEDNEVNMEDVKMFMSVIVGNSEFDDKIKPALGYKVPGLPRAVDITDARRSMGV